MVHRGDTNGGFPQHTETIIHALKELGHQVKFFYLDYCVGDKASFMAKKVELFQNGELMRQGHELQITKGIGTGEFYDSEKGWFCPVTPYKNMDDKKKLKAELEEYDAVFWHTPFWFKQKPTLMDTDWPMLLDLENPVNIGMVHDANLRANGAWQYFISKYFDKIITVHFASYNSASVLPVKRTLIFNPQDLSKVDESHTNFKNIKKTGKIFSLQNWKGSKHVDDLIRAVPYFSKKVKTVVAGDGIEARYMFGSKEKMKPQYYCTKAKDPDLPEKLEGKLTIAERAQETGRFEKLFWLDSDNRDKQMSEAAFFIDTAWYSVNKELGSHFSRTLIEAMMAGCVPIARNFGLSDNAEGLGELFKSNINYIMIPHDATPAEFAEIVNNAFKMDKKEYKRIVKNNYKLLENFCMLNVAKQYIKLIEDKKTGFFDKYEVGEPTEEFIKKAELQWFGTGDKRTFNFKKEESMVEETPEDKKPKKEKAEKPKNEEGKKEKKSKSPKPKGKCEFTPNENFKYYFYWISERMKIFWERNKGEEAPWTEDKILNDHKFTNVYRCLDRTSQYLIKHIINDTKKRSKEELFWRILLFKHFNSPDTWIALEKKFGDITLETKVKKIIKFLEKYKNEGNTIYSNAYMMTASFMKKPEFMKKYKMGDSRSKHEAYLKMLWNVFIEEGLAKKIIKSKSLEEVQGKFKEVITIGDFLAMQYTIDINYSKLIDFSENDFIVAGPGAIRGIDRTFDIESAPDYQKIIKWVHKNFDKLANEYGYKFKPLPKRALTLIDLQNCFCETDKYLRGRGIDNPKKEVGGKRIKQVFTQNTDKIEYVLPEKWEIKL